MNEVFQKGKQAKRASYALAVATTEEKMMHLYKSPNRSLRIKIQLYKQMN